MKRLTWSTCALFLVAAVPVAFSGTPAPPELITYWCDSCSPYGDGSDGTVVITGYTTLTRDMAYASLTVYPSATLNTHGYTVRVCDLLINLGVITDDDSGGAGGAGGDAGRGGDPCDNTPDKPHNPEAGQSGHPGSTAPCGGSGGAGGPGGGGGGGAERIGTVACGVTCRDADGGNGGTGGAGGKGGGCVRIYAYKLDNRGAIHADGQPGSPGTPGENGEYYPWFQIVWHDLAGGGGGGGAGGNGGAAGYVDIFYSDPISTGTFRANGGARGSGASGGSGHYLEYGIVESCCQTQTGVSGAGCAGDGGDGACMAGQTSESGSGGCNGAAGANHVVNLTELPYRVCVVRPDGLGDFPTIQAAIDANNPPCAVIELTNGVFRGPGNRDLDFHGKNLIVRSQSGDPNTCVIDPECAGRGFYFHTGETACAVVEGIAIIHGAADQGAAVYCVEASPTIRNCTIAGCCGSGAALEFDHGAPIVTGCQVTGNLDGAMIFWFVGSATVSTCTVAGNGAGTFAGGLAFYVCGASVNVSNSIVWGNCGREIWYGGIEPPPPPPIVYCCDVEGGWPGTNNINLDPLFCDPEPCENAPTAGGDYHLCDTSPCAAHPQCGQIGALGVGCALLPPPTLLSPPNGATNQPVAGTLDWSDVTGATGYRVQLGTSCGTGDEHNVTASEYPYSDLQECTTYYWRVKTRGVCGDGNYSNCFSFTTGPAPCPIAHWCFDDCTAVDCSGHGFDGTNSGAACVDGPGECGSAFEFTGTDIVKYIPSSMDDDIDTAFTTAAWVYWYGPNEYGRSSLILDARASGSPCPAGLAWGLGQDAHAWLAMYPYTAGDRVIYSVSTIPTGLWVYLAVTFDSSTHTLRLFIDGHEDNTASATRMYNNTNLQPALGNNRWAPADGQWAPFNGVIDEVRIYNTALSATEVCSVAHLCTCPADLNCDGAVNFADINPFVVALAGQAAYQAQYPNCLWLNADCNKDCLVNFADINPFVECLYGNCPDP